MSFIYRSDAEEPKSSSSIPGSGFHNRNMRSYTVPADLNGRELHPSLLHTNTHFSAPIRMLIRMLFFPPWH